MANLKVQIGNNSVSDITLLGHNLRLKADRFGHVMIGFKSTIAIIAFEALFPEGRYVEDEDGTPYFLIPGLKLEQGEFIYSKSAVRDYKTLRSK